MKKIISYILTFAMMAYSSVAVFAAEGQGTADNPIVISNAADLKEVANQIKNDPVGGEGKYYKLAADIDFMKPDGEAETLDFSIGSDSNPFRGNFDGDGYIIKNFVVNCTLDRVSYGLFGAAGQGAHIHNLGVENATLGIYTWQYIKAAGGIAGEIRDGAIISECYTKNISFWNNMNNVEYFIVGGGIAGEAKSGSKVINCYQQGMKDSCTAGTSVINFDAGIIGCAYDCVVENCYSDTTLVRKNIGTQDVIITNGFYLGSMPWPWGDETQGAYAGQSVSQLSAEQINPEAFVDDIKNQNNGLPLLKWQKRIPTLNGMGTSDDPYTISTVEDLETVSLMETEEKYFKLLNDIDFANTEAFVKIGNALKPFKGIFDGDGHVIKNYTIKAPKSGDTVYLGLFPYVGGNAIIADLGIENVKVSPAEDWGWNAFCGGLIGLINDNAEVRRCYVKNIVYENSADANYSLVAAGGLIGKIDGAGVVVKDCYSTDFVEKNDCIASDSGLIGQAIAFAKIENCYSDTTLTMCNKRDLANVVNSYYVTETIGSAYNRAGTVVSADALKTMTNDLGASYENDNATALKNNGYPVLKWQNGFDFEDVTQKEVIVEISTVEDLKAASNTDKKIKYILVNDIDLGGAIWNSYIGTIQKPFKGEFNGNGHIISNYKIVADGIDVYGLFGCVESGKIINLGVRDVNVEIGSVSGRINSIAALAATLKGSALVEGCFAKNVTITAPTGIAGNDMAYSEGALIGEADGRGVEVRNCYSTGVTLSGFGDYDAGIVGRITNCKIIENCYSDSTVARRSVTSGSWNVVNSYYMGAMPWPWGDDSVGGYKGVYADPAEFNASMMGDAFVTDSGAALNGGFPCLAWEKGFDVVTDPSYVDANGNITSDINAAASLSSVRVEKWNDKNASIVAASYANGVLKNAATCAEAVAESGIYNIDMPIENSADEIRIFIITDLSTQNPLGECAVYAKTVK